MSSKKKYNYPLNFRVEEEKAKKLKKLCAEKGLNQSFLFRKALDKIIEELEKE